MNYSIQDLNVMILMLIIDRARVRQLDKHWSILWLTQIQYDAILYLK